VILSLQRRLQAVRQFYTFTPPTGYFLGMYPNDLFFFFHALFLQSQKSLSRPVPWCTCNAIDVLDIGFILLFSSPGLKAQVRFLIARCPASVCLSVCKLLYFRPLLQNHWANFNQNWHKSSGGEGGFKFVQMQGRALP
jgi:hypothetical protein